jgi:hypothetical protein
MFRWSLSSFCLIALLMLGRISVCAPEPEKKDSPSPEAKTAVKGKPLPPNGRNAIDFLSKQQQAGGGWNGGPAAAAFEGMRLPGVTPKKTKAASEDALDVANTSIAALALMRAGFSPKQGAHSESLRKAIGGVLKSVEASDAKALAVTDRTGTQIQRKIGDNADTYLAAIMLASARGKMGDEKAEARLEKALQKIVHKMEANQKADGTWNGTGWAPVLSQALASRAINMAKQVGMKVDSAVLEKTAQHAKETFKVFTDGGGKGVGLKGMAAGVDLYGAAAAVSALQDAVNTNRALGTVSKTVLRSLNALDLERKEARIQLEKLDEWEKALREALKVLVPKVKDNKFVQGFGSDGGEEFLSFWLIGEALKLNELKEFGEWDKMMADRLSKSQNADSSWSGKHCITGETFCTATALLTMMSDRAPRPDDAMIVSRPTKPATPDKPATTVASTTEAARTDIPKESSEPRTLPVSEQLLMNLLSASDDDRSAILEKLRDGKGSDFTDALSRGANRLVGDAQKEAREVLIQRVARMSARTLRGFLQDEDIELRRAAIAVCGSKDDKQFVPDLISLLNDSEPVIFTSAHAVLKKISGQDFGPESDAQPAEKTKAILAWRRWWTTQSK